VVITFALSTLLLTACSQISSLTPVGGAALTSVRNATYDVLVDPYWSTSGSPSSLLLCALPRRRASRAPVRLPVERRSSRKQDPKLPMN